MKMNEKRNPGFIVRLLMLLMICCSAAAGAMAQTVVSGKITDKSTSDPLPGATVSITPNGGKTRLGVSDMDGKIQNRQPCGRTIPHKGELHGLQDV